MEKNIYLIDGHALIFKMYYAFLRRPMINSKGEDTSILFGFTKYLLEMLEREKPTHVAVAFDPPGGTFRNEIYPLYKANRDATPQLVIDALEPLKEICRVLRIAVIMKPGYEADDVIGSMAKKSEKLGYKVFMVTPDKDYGQLVSENILQYKPGKAGGENELIDVQGICQKYGIQRPEQVIDMLTICGDASDNVPGVKGVGEIGAGKLIAKYGSVENIYEHLGELTQRQRDAFIEARPHIGLSHTLVTIKTDVEVDLEPEAAAVRTDYLPEAAGLFRKYEFTSLMRFVNHVKEENKEEKRLEIQRLAPSEFCIKAASAGRIGMVAAFRGEGSGAELTELVAGTVVDGVNYCASGPCEDFKSIIEDEAVEKCGYDLKAQLNALILKGMELRGRLLDIELMHYLINPEKSHKVALLAQSYLDLSLEEHPGQPVQMSLFDEPEKEPEGARDAESIAVVLLAEAVFKDMAAKGADKLYLTMEEPLIRVLARMERTGVRIDLAQLRSYASSLGAELREKEAKIREMAGTPELNISSPMQVGIVLFEKLALDPKAKKSSHRKFYPTDEETLAAIADRHPIVNEILEFRAIKKLLSSYIEPFPSFVNPQTLKIHTTFNQALTATGRLSSARPNLQNIPVRTDRGKEIRKAFVPSSPEGLIVSADYSQIELRIMAHLSQDEHLIEAFRQGMDVHASTAAKIFGIDTADVTADQRRIAKTANFGIMYGISAFGLAQRLKIPRADAKKIIDDYFRNFPAISAFIESTAAYAREHGYVQTLFGRRRYLPDINSKNSTVRSLAERNAVNAPIQGTSADIIKIAMIRVDEELRVRALKSRMVLQVHDELVFDALPEEVAELEKIVVEKMQNVIELSVPLTVECNYGKNWLEAH